MYWSTINIPIFLFVIFVIICLSSFSAFSQKVTSIDSVLKKADTLLRQSYNSLYSQSDTTLSKLKAAFKEDKKHIVSKASEVKSKYRAQNLNDTSGNFLFDIQDFGLPRLSSPMITFGGGQVSYNFNYRSNADTPYAERNVYQHMISASADFSFLRQLPFAVGIWVRRSNSLFYRDVTDVQLRFNTMAFQQQLVSQYKQKLLRSKAACMIHLLKNAILF